MALGRFAHLVSACCAALLILSGCGAKAPSPAGSSQGGSSQPAAAQAPAKQDAAKSAPAAPEKLGTVRVGTLKFAFYQALWYVPKVASKYGFEVDMKEFKKALDAVEALKAGAIDVAVGGAEAAISAAATGVDLYVVGSFADGGLRLVVRKDFPGKELKDLVGAKVALVRGIQELALKAELKQAGLKWTDKGEPGAVQLVFFGATPDLNNALKTKQVDAMIQSEPGGAQAVAEGYARDFLLPYNTGLGRMPRAIMMSKKFYDSNPKLAEAFMKAFVESTMYLKANPEAGKKFMMEEVFKGQLPSEAYDQSMANASLTVDIPPSVLQTHADLMLEFGMLRQKVDVQGLLKLDALEKAKKELNYR